MPLAAHSMFTEVNLSLSSMAISIGHLRLNRADFALLYGFQEKLLPGFGKMYSGIGVWEKCSSRSLIVRYVIGILL